jgi:hypothetical protein
MSVTVKGNINQVHSTGDIAPGTTVGQLIEQLAVGWNFTNPTAVSDGSTLDMDDIVYNGQEIQLHQQTHSKA